MARSFAAVDLANLGKEHEVNTETETEGDLTFESPRNSLAARMAARRGEAEAAETELWELPGRFSDIVAVELRVLGWKTCADIARRHRRIRDENQRTLLVACDQVLRATVGFYEIVDGEISRDAPLPDETWVTIANRGVPDLSPDLTPRQALFALVAPDTLVVAWWNEWVEWMRERRPDIAEEVGRDFSKTG